jgi:hypothetical protein
MYSFLFGGTGFCGKKWESLEFRLNIVVFFCIDFSKGFESYLSSFILLLSLKHRVAPCFFIEDVACTIIKTTCFA